MRRRTVHHRANSSSHHVTKAKLKIMVRSSNSNGRRWWHRLVCCRGGDAERDSSHQYERIRREVPRVPLNTPPPEQYAYAYVGLGERGCSPEHAELMENLIRITGMLSSLIEVAQGYTLMRPIIPPRPPDTDVYHEWLLEWP